MDRRDGGILQHLLKILSSFISVWIMNFFMNVTLLSFPESTWNTDPYSWHYPVYQHESLIHFLTFL